MDRLPEELRLALEDILLKQRAHDPKINILGFGLGKKARRGQYTGEPAVRIFVQEKLSPWPHSSGSEIVPLMPWFPLKSPYNSEVFFNFSHKKHYAERDIPNLPMPGYIWSDIVPVSEPAIFQSCRGNFRGELIGGISIGLANQATGSIGCFVRNAKGSTNRPAREFYLLTAGHVLDLFDPNPPTDEVCQPGHEDQAKGTAYGAYVAAERVATTEVRLGTSKSYNCDAGIARPLNRPQVGVQKSVRQYAPEKLQLRIIECGGVNEISQPAVGMLVKKVGRTTGLTYGRITDVSLSYDISFGGQKATLSNQFATTMMSKRGDSGALLLDDSNRAVGLLAAGDDERSIFSPIGTVLRELDVELF